MRSFSSTRAGKAFAGLKSLWQHNPSRAVNATAACLSLGCVLLLPTFLSDSGLSFSNSYISVITAALLFVLFRRYPGRKHSKRELALTHVFGLMLSCMTAMGRATDQTGRFFPISPAMFAALLWEKLAEAEERKLTRRTDSGSGFDRLLDYVAQRRWLIAAILLLCWIPCWLALFPGGFNYDVENEFNQQFLIYKNDFPRLHTVIIIGCLNAAHALSGSYNAGIAFYALVQMGLFSALFSDMLVTFRRQNLRNGILCAMWVYCALFPVIALIVTNIGRDTLFAGLLTYLGFLLYQLATDSGAFLSTVRKPLLLGAVLSLTILSRNNNSELIMLVLLAALNVFVWLKSSRAHSRGIRVFIVSNIAVYVVLSAVLGAICQPIVGTNIRASMSVVSQTLCRAYVDEPEKWSDKDREDFEYHVNTKGFRYCAECADYSKNMLRNIKGSGNGVRFVSLWLRMGLKCPSSYMNAMIAQTRYMWNPDSVIDGYVRAELYDTEKCYFTTGVANPGKRVSLWKSGEDFYYGLSRNITFERIPVVSMLFSIGFHFWLILNCLFYLVYRRRKRMLLPLAVMLVYLAFCFFIPLVLMRYFMPLFLYFPLTAVMTLHSSPTEGTDMKAGDSNDKPTAAGQSHAAERDQYQAAGQLSQP